MAPLALTALPLTAEAWAPYGTVIEGSSDPTKIVPNPNPLPLYKFSRLSPVLSTHPPESSPAPVTAIHVIRIGPPAGLRHGGTFEIRMLERHPCNTQAFVPLSPAPSEWEAFNGRKALDASVGGMLVVGCLSGPDDRPDLSTLKVFVASPSQGLSYHANVWHHFVACFAQSDVAVVDTQITTDSSLLVDCEFIRLKEGEESLAVVQLPKLGRQRLWGWF